MSQSSEVLNIVIDERKALEAIDAKKISQEALLKQASRFSRTDAPMSMNSTGKVFKDYIMSSEPFYIDHDMAE